VKFPGEIRQTSGCSSKKFARERAKLKKKKEQTEVLEYWEVARNWDGCVPEISVALVCCEITRQRFYVNFRHIPLFLLLLLLLTSYCLVEKLRRH
jgi:hypothetical protein